MLEIKLNRRVNDTKSRFILVEFLGAFSYSFDFETYEMSAFEKYIYEFGNFESSFGCIMSNNDGSIDIREPRTKMVGTVLDQKHTGTKTFLKFSDKLDRSVPGPGGL